MREETREGKKKGVNIEEQRLGRWGCRRGGEGMKRESGGMGAGEQERKGQSYG